VVRIDNPDGTYTHTVYDGLVTTAIDANGHQKRFTNDVWGQLVQVKEFEGTYPGATLYATTEYEYDALGHLIEVTDDADNVTTMEYDGLGRKEAMDDPDMGHWEYRYDDAGNLTKQLDARGQATCFYYDELHRLEGKTYHENVTNIDTSFCSGKPCDVTYTYDESGHGYSIGRRTGMEDASGWTAWIYDVRGRVTKEIKTIDTQPFETEYTYDAADRVTSMEYPDGEVVTYDYNDGGTLEALSGIDSYVTGIDYNPMGQITDLALGNTLATWYTYDPLSSRLKNLQVGDLLNLSYDYDPVGNVTQIVDGHAPTFEDEFNTKNTTNWTWNSHQTVPYNDGGNNVVRNTGTDANWDANFHRSSYSLADGEGVKLRFKVNRTDTQAHFSIEANDSTYRRFGAIANDGKLYVQYADNGSNWAYPADLITNLQINTWYVLQIVLDDKDQGFYIQAYQESDPSVRGSYSVQMPAGKQWRFHHWMWRGNTLIDNYEEFDAAQQFTYDHLDRLTHAQATGGPAPYNRTYAYDEIGNITHKDGMGGYTYLGNGYTHSQPHAVTHIEGQRKYWYDANGNMTQRIADGKTYVQGFSAENKLQTVTEGGQTTAFTYDGDGNRVKKVDPSGTTYYVGGYYELKISGETEVTLLNPSFEDSTTGWSETASSEFPGTSIWRATWGTADQHSGEYGYAISNHAYGYLRSDAIAISPNTAYDLYAWVRGEIDPDDSGGGWIIRASFFDSGDVYIGYQNAASGGAGTLSTTWQNKGGRITTPANAATVRIDLYNYLNSGWVAYDDVSLQVAYSDGDDPPPSPVVPNPGFESSTGWSENIYSEFPGTAIWRGMGDTAAPHSGSYGYVISNHASGYLESDWISLPEAGLSTLSGSPGYLMRSEPLPPPIKPTLVAPNTPVPIEPTLGPRPTSAPEPTRTPTSAPEPTRTPTSAPGPTPWPTSAPEPTRTPTSAPTPTPIPTSTPEPVISTYELSAWVRGELDPDDSHGQWGIRACFQGGGVDMGCQDIVSGAAGTLSTTWEQKAALFTPPIGATEVRIRLYNEFNSGWIAFDDISLTEVGDSTNLIPNPGFESGTTGWSENASPEFPGTSIWRGTWGTADQHSGEYAYAISNHVYGYLRSDAIAVSPNTEYDLYAWVRGELDPDDSSGSWIIRANFYDSSGSYISYQDAASGGAGSLTTTWQEKGGTITTPSNAATVRIDLYNYMNSGWVACDDVRVVTPGQVTKYYYAGNQRVAMRQGGTVTYLHGDHLGSTSLTTDANGDFVARVLYYPYGETRYEEGTLPTDYGFTGQRKNSYLDTYSMGAREYDPSLGRWLSADTIVPDPANPQSFNRFTYVYNNPLKYVDPSGHDPLDENWQEEFRQHHNGRDPDWRDRLIRLFSIAFPDEWNDEYGNNFFYNEDGTYREGSMEDAFKEYIPADRSWAAMPDALERLAGWYKEGETSLLVRDIGSLFGGLPDRFNVSSMRTAATGCENGYTCDNGMQLPAHIWVGVNPEGLNSALVGNSDWDANVHHWAWALVLGYSSGSGAGIAMNTIREHGQAGASSYRDINARADILIGNRGAQMGADMRWFSHSRGWTRHLFVMYMIRAE